MSLVTARRIVLAAMDKLSTGVDEGEMRTMLDGFDCARAILILSDASIDKAYVEALDKVMFGAAWNM